MAPEVFISYARPDEEVASKLRALLEAEGWAVWWDQQLYAGARWEDDILAAIAGAQAVIVLWSAHSAASAWVLREAGIAAEQRKLVPVLIGDELPPAPFDRIEAARLAGWRGQPDHRELPVLFDGLGRLAPPSRIDTVRPGYDVDFLGVPVDLPSIPGAGDEFRYLHFSVVMNPARRLAWYVAYTIEPQTFRPYRVDRWLPDPTLSRSFQPANEHFSGTGFDRGHIISPASVAWGPERPATIAMRQAFFWTNTSPQAAEVNRRTWLALEQFERQKAAEHGRVAGFSGPVLDPDDPLHVVTDERRGRVPARQTFRLPRAYWKVVVWMGDRRPVTACFTVTNTEHGEPPVERSVTEIERLTGLGFPEILVSSRAGA